MKRISRLVAILSLGIPLSAFAAGIDTSYITPYSSGIINVINGIFVPVLFALAFIVFLWGVFKYFILGAANEDDRKEGRQFVLWGVIGFVVILSIWGLVNLLMGILGLSAGTAPAPPTFSPSAAPAGNTGAVPSPTYPSAADAQCGGNGSNPGGASCITLAACSSAGRTQIAGYCAANANGTSDICCQ